MFLTPLVTPVKVLPDIPVYEISSEPICTKFVPEVGNKDASVNIIVVVTALIPPFKVVVASPVTVPPHAAKPQPKPGNCSAGPTG